jgi:hypothetical protein
MEKPHVSSLLKAISFVLVALLLLCVWQFIALAHREALLEALLIDSVGQWGVVANKSSEPAVKAMAENVLANRIVSLADVPQTWSLDRHQRLSAIAFGLHLLAKSRSPWLSPDESPSVSLRPEIFGDEFVDEAQENTARVHQRLLELADTPGLLLKEAESR